MRHHLWSVLKQIFFLMPDFVALLLTAIGLGVIFMNKALQELVYFFEFSAKRCVCHTTASRTPLPLKFHY